MFGERQRIPKSSIVALVIIIILTALCYKSFWGNVWYFADDYFTVDLGGAASIWDAGGNITSNLYKFQGRYQPVRLYLFSLVTHLIPEEYSFFYNFGMHLANVTLLFLLLRNFRVCGSANFIICVLFSTYGLFRAMESPCAMIGGSGLNAFLVLITLWFLMSALSSSSFQRKYLFLALSYLTYMALVFSYEVAFPMLMTIIFGFLFYNAFVQGHPLFSLKKYLILLPYMATLIFFYLFFYKPSGYEGAQIHFNSNILTRLLAYSEALLLPFTKYSISLRWELFLALLIYYPAVYWILNQNRGQKDSHLALAPPLTCLFLIFFGLLWYFSSVLLFILNNWLTPTSVMVHHLYLMNVGTSMLITGLLLSFRHVLIPPLKKVFSGFLIYFLVPIFLMNFFTFNLRYGEGYSAEKTRFLFTAKKQIQNYVPDVRKVDAIILKNFLQPNDLLYYQISHFNGAFLQWFSFKKYVESGDDILSTRNGRISLKAPLSYYDHIYHTRTVTFPEDKIELFYYDSQRKRLLTYGETIDFIKGINLHQADQVWSSMDRKTEMGPLKVVLRNPGVSRFLTIEFQGQIDTGKIQDNLVMALNDEPVPEVNYSENSIVLPLSSLEAKRKYLFLQLDSPDQPELISKIEKIYFQNTIVGTRVSLPKSAVFDFQNYIPRYHLGSQILFTGQRSVEFINWYDAEPTHRWARGKKGIIHVHLGGLNPGIGKFALTVKGFTLGPQEVKIWLNGVLLTAQSHVGLINWEIPFEGKILKPNALNVIEFEIPGAKKPGTADERTLGFALQELRFVSVHPPSPVAAGK